MLSYYKGLGSSVWGLVYRGVVYQGFSTILNKVQQREIMRVSWLSLYSCLIGCFFTGEIYGQQ